MVKSKSKNNFWSQIFIHFTGSPQYEEFQGIICHSLLYFAILTYMNYSVLHPLVRKIKKYIWYKAFLLTLHFNFFQKKHSKKSKYTNYLFFVLIEH